MLIKFFVGDPDDISLRKMEMKLLIPQIRREYIKNEKCPKEIEGIKFISNSFVRLLLMFYFFGQNIKIVF